MAKILKVKTLQLQCHKHFTFYFATINILAYGLLRCDVCCKLEVLSIPHWTRYYHYQWQRANWNLLLVKRTCIC